MYTVDDRLKHCSFWCETRTAKQKHPLTHPLLAECIAKQEGWSDDVTGSIFLINFGSTRRPDWSTAVVLKCGKSKKKFLKMLVYCDSELFLLTNVMASIAKHHIRVPNLLPMSITENGDVDGNGDEDDEECEDDNDMR